MENEIKKTDFLMSIDNVFSISGHGTVVTGRVERGKLQLGDMIEVVGMGAHLKTSCVRIERFQKPKEHCSTGEYVGIYVSELEKNMLRRGMVLAVPDSVKAYSSFVCKCCGSPDVEERLLDSAEKKTLKFVFRNATILGKAEILDRCEGSKFGEILTMKILLDTSVVMDRGLTFHVTNGRDEFLSDGVVTEISG